MAPSLESLGIDKLCVYVRIALADAIWEFVEAEFTVPGWHIEELRDREVLHAPDRTAERPWSEALTSMTYDRNWKIIEKRLKEPNPDQDSGATWQEVRDRIESSGHSH